MTRSYRDAYAQGRLILEEAQIADAALDARLLLEHVCGTERHTLFTAPMRPLTEAECEAYETLIERRGGERMPVAYLLGSWDFMGLTFRTDARALIPRQDTEFVAEEALKHLHDGMRFLDLCTGTGCIALSLLHYTNHTQALATDLSEDALALAEENAHLLGEKNLRTACCDLFPESDERFDLIVSNPPYIRSSEIDTLQDELRHEPRMALDGGSDGLVFYRRIAKEAPRRLNRGAYLILETGFDETDEVALLLRENGFRNIDILRDYGGNPRVVKGCFYEG